MPDPRHPRFLSNSGTAHHRGWYTPKNRTFRQLQGIGPRVDYPSCQMYITRNAKDSSSVVLNAGSEGFGDLTWVAGTPGPYGTPGWKAVQSGLSGTTTAQTWRTKAFRLSFGLLGQTFTLYQPVSGRGEIIDPPHVTDPSGGSSVPVIVSFPRGFVEPWWAPGVSFPDVSIRISHVQLLSDGVALSGVEATGLPFTVWGGGTISNASHTFHGIEIPRDEELMMDHWCEVRLNADFSGLTDIGIGWDLTNNGGLTGDPFTAHAHFPPFFVLTWFNTKPNFNPNNETLELNFIGHDTGVFNPTDPWKLESSGSYIRGASNCSCSVVRFGPTEEWAVRWNNEVAELSILNSDGYSYYRPTGSEHHAFGTTVPYADRPMGLFDLDSTVTFEPFATNVGSSHPRNPTPPNHYRTGYPTSIEVTKVAL